MKKMQLTANITALVCLFLALFTVVFCGIPFLNVPAVSDFQNLNLSTDFSDAYRFSLSVEAAENTSLDDVCKTIQARIDALPYNDVVLKRDNASLSIETPKSLGAKAKELCVLLITPGKIAYLDPDGNEIIPQEAVYQALAGYGKIPNSGQSASFYLEFFLREEYREDFSAATKALALKSKDNQNIIRVTLDGSTILQASVSEEMNQDTFLIGSSFEDASLPNLYASYINGGRLHAKIGISDNTIVPAPHSTAQFMLYWCALIGLCVLLSLFALPYKAHALSLFTALLLCLLSTTILYQAAHIRFSLFTFLGIAIGVLLIFTVCMFLFRRLFQELKNGRPLTAAVTVSTKFSLVFYLVFHACAILLSALCLILSSGSSPAFKDTAVPIFFSSLWSAATSLFIFRFFCALFANAGLTTTSFYKQK